MDLSTAADAQSCASAPETESAYRIRYASQGHEVTQPIRVHSRADMASILRAHRIAKRLTCEQFDAIAGWSDRYVTKAEHEVRARITVRPPSLDDADDGGTVDVSFMAEIWFETAGLALVLMPADMAERIGAVDAPKREGAR